jgi:cyanate lyase
MSNPEARLALAKLIADRMAELNIQRREFMTACGFTNESTFTCYLRGFSNLQVWQVPAVADLLQLDEREVLIMCLAQSHDEFCMDLFLRHVRRRRKRSGR